MTLQSIEPAVVKEQQMIIIQYLTRIKGSEPTLILLTKHIAGNDNRKKAKIRLNFKPRGNGCNIGFNPGVTKPQFSYTEKH
jgi:hypothetical protein